MPNDILRTFVQRYGWSLLVAVLAASMFTINLGAARLWDDDEPKNAGCGIEMLERGDYVVPMFNGELRSHKPVMLYWWMIVSYAALGISEFSARLPSALASIGTLVATYHVGRLLFDRMTGLLGALLLGVGLMFAVLSRAATPDGVLIMFLMSSLLLLVIGLRKSTDFFETKGYTRQQDIWRLPTRAAVCMYLAMGAAVLTKGPIGVILPLTAFFAFALLAVPAPTVNGGIGTKAWAWLRHRLSPRRIWHCALSLRVPIGLAIVAVVVLPWYVAVSVATEGAWLTGFLGTHNVHRFLEPMEGHQGSPFYHVISVMAGMFPASCFLPVAIYGAIQGTKQGSLHRGAYLLLLCWAFTWVGFFSVAATKLPNYVVPSYPAFALLAAAWLANAVRSMEAYRHWLRLGFASLILVGLALVVGMATLLPQRLENSHWLALVGVPPLVGGLIALELTWHRSLRPAVATFAVTSVVFTASALWFVAPIASQQQASFRLADWLEQSEPNDKAQERDLASYRYTRPNLTFYLRQPVDYLLEASEVREFLAGENRAVVMPEDCYEQVAPELPFATQVIADQDRFLKPGKRVVIVERVPQIAQQSDTLRR